MDNTLYSQTISSQNTRTNLQWLESSKYDEREEQFVYDEKGNPIFYSTPQERQEILQRIRERHLLATSKNNNQQQRTTPPSSQEQQQQQNVFSAQQQQRPSFLDTEQANQQQHSQQLVGGMFSPGHQVSSSTIYTPPPSNLLPPSRTPTSFSSSSSSSKTNATVTPSFSSAANSTGGVNNNYMIASDNLGSSSSSGGSGSGTESSFLTPQQKLQKETLQKLRTEISKRYKTHFTVQVAHRKTTCISTTFVKLRIKNQHSSSSSHSQQEEEEEQGGGGGGAKNTTTTMMSSTTGAGVPKASETEGELCTYSFLPERVRQQHDSGKANVVLLSGAAGSGKSHLLQMLSLEQSFDSHLIVFIPLREVAELTQLLRDVRKKKNKSKNKKKKSSSSSSSSSKHLLLDSIQDHGKIESVSELLWLCCERHKILTGKEIKMIQELEIPILFLCDGLEEVMLEKFSSENEYDDDDEVENENEKEEEDEDDASSSSEDTNSSSSEDEEEEGFDIQKDFLEDFVDPQGRAWAQASEKEPNLIRECDLILVSSREERITTDRVNLSRGSIETWHLQRWGRVEVQEYCGKYFSQQQQLSNNNNNVVASSQHNYQHQDHHHHHHHNSKKDDEEYIERATIAVIDALQRSLQHFEGLPLIVNHLCEIYQEENSLKNISPSICFERIVKLNWTRTVKQGKIAKLISLASVTAAASSSAVLLSLVKHSSSVSSSLNMEMLYQEVIGDAAALAYHQLVTLRGDPTLLDFSRLPPSLPSSSSSSSSSLTEHNDEEAPDREEKNNNKKKTKNITKEKKNKVNDKRKKNKSGILPFFALALRESGLLYFVTKSTARPLHRSLLEFLTARHCYYHPAQALFFGDAETKEALLLFDREMEVGSATTATAASGSSPSSSSASQYYQLQALPYQRKLKGEEGQEDEESLQNQKRKLIKPPPETSLPWTSKRFETVWLLLADFAKQGTRELEKNMSQEEQQIEKIERAYQPAIVLAHAASSSGGGFSPSSSSSPLRTVASALTSSPTSTSISSSLSLLPLFAQQQQQQDQQGAKSNNNNNNNNLSFAESLFFTSSAKASAARCLLLSSSSSSSNSSSAAAHLTKRATCAFLFVTSFYFSMAYAVQHRQKQQQKEGKLNERIFARHVASLFGYWQFEDPTVYPSIAALWEGVQLPLLVRLTTVIDCNLLMEEVEYQASVGSDVSPEWSTWFLELTAPEGAIDLLRYLYKHHEDFYRQEILAASVGRALDRLDRGPVADFVDTCLQPPWLITITLADALRVSSICGVTRSVISMERFDQASMIRYLTSSILNNRLDVAAALLRRREWKSVLGETLLQFIIFEILPAQFQMWRERERILITASRYELAEFFGISPFPHKRIEGVCFAGNAASTGQGKEEEEEENEKQKKKEQDEDDEDEDEEEKDNLITMIFDEQTNTLIAALLQQSKVKKVNRIFSNKYDEMFASAASSFSVMSTFASCAWRYKVILVRVNSRVFNSKKSRKSKLHHRNHHHNHNNNNHHDSQNSPLIELDGRTIPVLSSIDLVILVNQSGSNLRYLNLNGGYVNLNQVVLVAAEKCPNLEKLFIEGTQVEASTLKKIVQHCSKITQLDLSRNDAVNQHTLSYFYQPESSFSTSATASSAASHSSTGFFFCPSKLEVLRLANCYRLIEESKAAGFSNLISAASSSLVEIDLEATSLHDDSLRCLSCCSKLQRLNIAKTRYFSDDGFCDFIEGISSSSSSSTSLCDLTHLDISCTHGRIGDASIQMLSVYCPKLVFLNISETSGFVSDSSLIALVNSPCGSCLEYLDVSFCESQISDRSLFVVAEKCVNLQYLSVSCSNFQSDAVTSLSITKLARQLPKLHSIDLSSTLGLVSDDAILALANRKNVSGGNGIRSLYVDETEGSISDASLEKLFENNNNTLINLNLSGNNQMISDKSLVKIPSSIQKVCAHDCKATFHTMDSITQRCKELRFVDFESSVAAAAAAASVQNQQQQQQQTSSPSSSSPSSSSPNINTSTTLTSKGALEKLCASNCKIRCMPSSNFVLIGKDEAEKILEHTCPMFFACN